jgi:hypothetical protein
VFDPPTFVVERQQLAVVADQVRLAALVPHAPRGPPRVLRSV